MGAGGRPGVLEEFEKLKPEIEKCVKITAIDFKWERDMSDVDADIAIVFGGDGSVLRSAHQMQGRQRPVLAVNLGTLGFLANLQADGLIDVLKNLDPCNLPTVKHLMLQCQIWRAAHSDKIQESRICLNEVMVFHGEDTFRIVNLPFSVDGLPVTTFRCDGLILSTPVGSTGHNLSAGGPIIRKDLDAVLITPVNPHTLNQRPVIDSADRIYELQVQGSTANVMVDGTIIAKIEPEDRVIVRRADVSFRMIETPEHGYYATLRDKLGWSGCLSSLEMSYT